MSGKLFKIKHDETTTCTIGWLKQKIVHDFGPAQIKRILDNAGVNPEYTARNADGVQTAVYNLHRALDAIYAYRRSLYKPKRNREWSDQYKDKFLKDLEETLNAVTTAAKGTEFGTFIKDRTEPPMGEIRIIPPGGCFGKTVKSDEE